MVSSCCVVGCTNRVRRDNGKRFFRFPKVNKNHLPTLQKLTSERREKWISAVNRKSSSGKEINYNGLRVCSDHFTLGKPAEINDQLHPDWAPSLKMGYANKTEEKSVASHERYNRQLRRITHSIKPEKLNHLPENMAVSSLTPNTPVQLTDDEHMAGTDTAEVEDVEIINTTTSERSSINTLGKNKNTKRDESAPHLQGRNESASNLKEIAICLPFSEETFAGDDSKLNFYTGIPNMKLFSFILKHITYQLQMIRCSKLTPFQKLTLTLMKLRFDDAFDRLSYEFGVNPFVVGKIFRKVIVILEYTFQDVLHWPDANAIKRSTPNSFANFREVFEIGDRPIRVILDCFEVKIEKPASVQGKSEVFSNYKHYHTLKYLIGITPFGFISFISEGWGGRTSDTEIIQRGEFLNLLNPGDVVVADRGFSTTVRELIEQKNATLLTPTFIENQQQIHPVDVERTRTLASCRIHVERVIGTLRNKFKILRGPVPISIIQYEHAGNDLFDLIVRVCCIICNICDPVVKK